MRVNEKLDLIKETTLIAGIDIAKKKHYVRFVDYRGNDLSKPLGITNDEKGFDKLKQTIEELKVKYNKENVIIGCEPTGHYWFNINEYIQNNNLELVIVSTYATKQAKELDDNNPTKSDPKDAYVIARLVSEGRYSKPIIRDGLYKDIYSANHILEDIRKEMVRVKNQIHRWNDIYFPELEQLYKIDSVDIGQIYKNTLLPEDIDNMSILELTEILTKDYGYFNKKKILKLVELAKTSVGIKKDAYTKTSIERLYNKLVSLTEEKEKLENEIIEVMSQIDYINNIVEITGVGYGSMISIVSECGNLENYDHYKQVIKLSGLSLKENSSGTKKGKKHICKRGRPGLRRTLKLIALSLVCHNESFRSLHEYYTTQRDRKLEKLVSINAIINKFVRVMMSIVKNKSKFSKEKLVNEACISLV